MKHFRANARGFSLVEVMTAVFFTSMSMAGTTALLSGILRGNAFSAAMTSAMTSAQDKVDELRDMRFSAVESGTDQQGRFQRDWTVLADGNRKEVSVTVQWISLDGVTRIAALNTLLSE